MLLPPVTVAELVDDGPTLVAAGKAENVLCQGYLGVRVYNNGGAAVSVRPWIYRDGRWWAWRFDADPAARVEPVKADPALMNGTATGQFIGNGLSCPVALVVESGDGNDIAEMHLDIL
jgi:hypothetical protein